MKKITRVLSGMRPTGNLHLGNYFGAIKQFLDLQAEGHECFFFAADIHALTEATGPTDVDQLSVEVAKNYLACGIDPQKSTLYRQSDVPEISEIAVLLGNIVRLNRLQTCTTFKDRIHNRGVSEGEVSYGLLGYPVLMASDILAVRGERVPVGKDQMQHIEMARDFARDFNRIFGQPVLTIPEANEQNPPRIPGIDGAEKMGKSDGNAIALLENPATIVRKIKSIPTQLETGEGVPKTPGTEALFSLMYACSPFEVYHSYDSLYKKPGGKFFGEMKARLAEDILALLEPIQARYHALHDDQVREVLSDGAKKVRVIAQSVLHDMQDAIGLTRKGVAHA